MVSNSKQQTNLSTWRAPYPTQLSSMMRSPLGFLSICCIWTIAFICEDSLWNRISLKTKLKVSVTWVLPSLLYACETWTVYSWHAKQLNSFYMRCLRKLFHINGRTKYSWHWSPQQSRYGEHILCLAPVLSAEMGRPCQPHVRCTPP